MAVDLASPIELVGDLNRTYEERLQSLFDTFSEADQAKSLSGIVPYLDH